jgi:phage recombination protein Bet
MNATAIVQQNGSHELNLTREQVELVKRTVAQGSTDDELKLFLHAAQRMGLDPLAKQIYAVKRWDSVQRRDVMAIQVGIDGFRLTAQRTREADGQEGPYWCGQDGLWRDVWMDAEPPVAAKVVVYRKGQSRPYTGVAMYKSYCQTNRDGHPVAMWKKMPENQLAKCAEALALRKAFPAELGNAYTPEEMAQADSDVHVIERKPEPKDPIMSKLQEHMDSGTPAEIDPEDYIIPIAGKNKGKVLRDMGERELAWYAENAKHSELKRYAQAAMAARLAKAQAAQQAEYERVMEVGEDPAGLAGSDRVGSEVVQQ